MRSDSVSDLFSIPTKVGTSGPCGYRGLEPAASRMTFRRPELSSDKLLNGFVAGEDFLRMSRIDFNGDNIRIVGPGLLEHAVLDHAPDGKPIVVRRIGLCQRRLA